MKFSIVLSAQPTSFAAVAFRGDFEANLARIVEMGYDGVELAIRQPSEMDYPTLVSLLARYDLAVPAIGTGQAWGEERLSFTDPDPNVRQAAVLRACAHIPFAAEMNAQIIIGLLRGIVQPGVSHSQATAWLVECLQECAAAAAAEGVRLCLEPLNRYETGLIHTVAEGMMLIEQVGADNFGLLLDTFHMNIEEPNIADSIRKAGKSLFHFHVADSNRWHPGAGHIDFGRVLGVLNDVGYAGFVSGEFMPVPDAFVSAERAIAHLRDVACS